MRSMVRAVAVFVVLSLTANAFAGNFVPGGAAGIPRQYIVLFNESFPGDVEQTAHQLAAKHGGKVRLVWPIMRGFSIAIDESAARTLSVDSRVRLVEQVLAIQASSDQNTKLDPQCVQKCATQGASCLNQCGVADARQWHLDRLDQDSPLLDGHYNYCTTGSGVKVYVVDSGVMASHKEFKPGQVEAGYDASTAEGVPDEPGMTADNPCNGWPEPAVDPRDDPNANADAYRRFTDAVDGLGHGTAVASLVAGQRTGVAKDAQIVPVKVNRCGQATARPWLARHDYAENALIVVAAKYFRAGPSGGRSGANQPNWNNTTVTDNDITWTDVTSAVNTDKTTELVEEGLEWIARTATPGKSLVTMSTYEYRPEDYPNRTGTRMEAIDAAIRTILAIHIPVIASANNQDIDACNTTPARLSRNNPNSNLRGNVITVGGSMIRNRLLNGADSAGRGIGVSGTQEAAVNAPFLEPAANPHQPVQDARWICGAGDTDGCTAAAANFTQYLQTTRASNFGQCVTLFAPAKNITVARLSSLTASSAIPEYRDRLGSGNDYIPALASGTSWSAPIAAGVAARYLQTRPDANHATLVQDVHDALVNTALVDVLDPVTLNGSPNLLLRAADVMFTQQATASRTEVFTTDDAKHRTVQLSIKASGLGALTYHWYAGARGDTSHEVGSGEVALVTPTQTTQYWARVSSGTCSSATDSRNVTVRVTCPDAPQVEVTAPSNAAPGSLTLTANAPGATAYTWYAGAPGDGAASIGSGNPLTVNIDETTSYWVRVTGTSGCTRDSAPKRVFVCKPAEVTTPALPMQLRTLVGSALNVAVEAKGSNLKYEWFRGDVNDTSNPLAATAVSESQARVSPPDLNQPETFKYWVRITPRDETGTACGTAASVEVADVTRCSSFAYIVPQNQTVTRLDDQGQTRIVNLQATAPGSNLRFQWYRGRTGDISQPVYTSTGTTSVYAYTVGTKRASSFWIRIADPNDSCRQVDSTNFWVFCSDCRKPTRIGTDDQEIYKGNDAILSAPETSTAYAYEWRVGAAQVDAAPVFSTDATTIVAPEVTTWYWVRARIAATNDIVYDADPAAVTVIDPPLPTISVTPSTTVVDGTQVTLTVNVPNATYEWRVGMPEKYPTGPVIGTAQTLTVTPHFTTSYWVRVIDSIGWRNSNAMTITVTCLPLYVAIATNPNPPYVPNTQNALLYADAVGTGVEYVWYSIAADGTETIAGQQPSIMPTIFGPTGRFKVTVTDDCGNSATSSTVTVYQCLPTFDFQPTQNPIVPPNTPGHLTVHANPAVAGQPAPAYRWYEQGDVDATNPVGSGPDLDITLPAGVTSRSYFAIATGTCNGTEKFTRSEVGTISNCAYPVIQSQTGSGSIQLPAQPSATLQVVASGTSLTYQWYRRELNGSETLLTGETNQQITVSPTGQTTYFCRIKSRNVCTTDSNPIVVNVCATPQYSQHPAPQTINANNTATLSAAISSPTGTETYQWYRGNLSSSTLISGATSSTYTTPALTADTQYYVVTTRGACSNPSNVATVTVCSLSTSVSGAGNIASGQTVTLTATTYYSRATVPTYTWYEGSTAIQSGTANTLTRNPTTTRTYRVKVNDGTCETNSAEVTANVCIPTITSNPTDRTINSGDPFTLTVSASGDGLTYQWYSGSAPLNGKTSPSLTVTGLTSTTSYWARVTGCTIADSAVATVTVCQPPAVTQQPLTVTVNSGVPAQLSVTATGTSLLTYQWYEGTPGTTTTPVGTSSAVLNVTTTVTRRYWVKVSNGCGTVNSAQGWVQVAPSITTQTQASPKYVTSGTPSTFSVAAGGTFLTYQWYEAPSTAISGATSTSYTTGNLTSNKSLFCRICSGSACVDSNTETAVICQPKGVSVSQPSTVAGSAVTMSIVQPDGNETYTWYQGPVGNTSNSLGTGTAKIVSPTTSTSYWVQSSGYGCTANSPAININICQPRIDASPQSVFVSSGQPVSLTVAATGPAPLTYQWYEGSSGNTSSPVSGATGATLSFTAQSGTRYYWCRVTSAAGGSCTANSQAAEVRVCVPPSITSQPSSAFINSTDTVTLSVGATGDELTYQWYESTSGNVLLTGQTSSTLVITPGTNTRGFWVRVSGSCGSVDSAVATQYVYPNFTLQPANTSACAGGTATFSAAATGNDTTFWWYEGESGQYIRALGSGSSISLVVNSTTRVWCEARNGPAVRNSQAATASITPGPTVSIAKTYMGWSFTYTLTASVPSADAGYVTYQWYRGPMSNTASSTAGPASPSWMVDEPNSTQYWVRVTDTRTGCRTDQGVMVPW